MLQPEVMRFPVQSVLSGFLLHRRSMFVWHEA
jgi:hypothetical protein